MEKLIDAGGDNFVLEVDNDFNRTALHYVCNRSNATIKVVELLCMAGGDDLVTIQQNIDGKNALHCACLRTSSDQVLVVS